MKNRASFRKTLSALLVCLFVLALTVPAFAAGEGINRISCSVFGDGKSGRGFCWFTEKKTGSDLQLVKSGEFDGNFENALSFSGTVKKYRGRFSHKVSVTGLEPGEKYTYRVGDKKAGCWSEPCSFVLDDGDESFSFIAIADVQAGTDEKFASAARTLKGAVETLPESEFIVNLGDYVNDNTNEEWDLYSKHFSFANERFTGVPVAGNHDGSFTNKANANCFKNTFCLDESANRSVEGVYYSFDYGNAHFAVLNTNDMYPMSQAQRNWLVNDMTASGATWKIILMHRSMFSAGKNINKPDTVIMRNDLLPIIDRLDVDLVLSGHDHMYMRTKQVKGEKEVENVGYVTEAFNGKETNFALDPDGTCFIIPSTAGTKRYVLNENPMPPINEVSAVSFSTRDLGGCFSTIEIDGGKLVFKAFVVDDETGETVSVDEYAIKKTKSFPLSPTKLDQSFASTVYTYPFNFFKAILQMFVSYFKLLLSLF